jgi:alkylhydroperoxidase family enzyme
VQKEGHKLTELEDYWESDKFSHREKIALRYCDAIMGNPLDADEELWTLLHEEFTEPELVELGYYIGFKSGGQRWLITLHTQHGELEEATGIKVTTPEESYEIRYGSTQFQSAD